MKWKSAPTLVKSKPAERAADGKTQRFINVPPGDTRRSGGNLRSRWSRASAWVRWLVIGLVVLLIAARLALPAVVERYVNHQLNKSKEYSGRIGGVNIELWRGKYRINKPEIFKRTGAIKTPLFSADRIHLAVEWRELFHGSVVGKVRMEEPQVNIVSGPSAAQTQTGKDESWNSLLESLFPFKLNRFEIINGQVHFQNEYSTPPVDIYLSKLQVTATNFTNSRDVKSALPAGIVAHGTTIGGGGLTFQAQVNPLAKAPTYQLTAQLTNVDLTALNNFLRAYGKFDVARGQFAIFTSVASKDGNYDGYVKVFFKELKVFAWEKERGKNILKIFWDGVVGTVATVFKNQPKDTLAMRVPISGAYGKTSVGTWTAVSTMLQNAFIQALVPKIDQKVTIRSVEQKNGQ